MRKETTISWQDAIKAYCDKWHEHEVDVRDGSIPAGATEAQLSLLREAAKVRGLHLDDDALAFLRIVNGTSFEGLTFYGAAIPAHDRYEREDFIRSNDDFNAEQSRYTEYGTWEIDIYRFDAVTRRFVVLDSSGYKVLKSFATFGELMQYAIMAHVLDPAPNSGKIGTVLGRTSSAN
ncbi:MAG: YrhA family protein [Vulcanimicrobiaceae bacterium]